MGKPAIAPRLRGGPVRCVDDVEGVCVAPLAAVGPAELAAISGGAAEVDGQEGDAGLDHELAEGQPVAESLMRRPAVRVDHARNARRLLPDCARGQVESPFDGQPVPSLEGDTRPGCEAIGVDDDRQGMGQLTRPDSLGRCLGHRQQPQVVRQALARAECQDGGRVRQPRNRHPHAVERAHDRRLSSLDWKCLRAAVGQVADEQVDQPIPNLNVDEALAVGRGQGHVAPATARFAMLTPAGGENRSVTPVGGDADYLEPAILVRDHEQARAVGQPTRSRLPCRLPGNQLRPARGDVDDVDLHGQQIRQAL